MILKLKVMRAVEGSDEENMEFTEEVVDFVVKGECIEGVWVEPDFMEMYIYINGNKVTVDYDKWVHKEVCTILGHPEYKVKLDNGLS